MRNNAGGGKESCLPALAFWAKYPEQMDALDEFFDKCDDAADEGSRQPEPSKELAALFDGRRELLESIIDRANNEADQLTRALANRVASAFVDTKRARATIKRKHWSWESAVYFQGHAPGRPKPRWLWAGFNIKTAVHASSHRLEIVSWLWLRNDAQITEKAMKVLKAQLGQEIVDARKLFPNWESGTIVVSRTPMAPGPDGFSLNQEQLLRDAAKAFDGSFLSANRIAQLTELANQ